MHSSYVKHAAAHQACVLPVCGFVTQLALEARPSPTSAHISCASVWLPLVILQ